MWQRITQWSATRAATGWVLALGMSIASGLWYAYDLRGDKIMHLELELSKCKGGARQAQAIESLAKRLNEQAREKGDDEVEEIKKLPNDCYFLDGPSPLNGVRRPKQPG